MTSFKPNWSSSPGTTIAAILRSRRVSNADFAKRSGFEAAFVEALLEGSGQIDQTVAAILERELGSTSQFWLVRESRYRESLKRVADLSSTEQLLAWVERLPTKDMTRFGWLTQKKSPNLIDACLDFFDIKSLQRWQILYEEKIMRFAFRTSAAFDTNPASVAAWLRRGELAAKSIGCAAFSKNRLVAALPMLRELTREKSPAKFFPVLKSTCASFGVAIVMVRAPEGCRASGATRFLSRDKALVQLSHRYKTDDQFWFTFFHELGHVVRHAEKSLMLEDIGDNTTKEEDEANSFARDALLAKHQQQALKKVSLTYKDVIRFARSVRLSPGIVVGQLQHFRITGFDRLNKAKRVLEWGDILL